ncbi:MAG: hypothetical protein RIM99_20350 [Cyclobacteriaceae bacterium]
MSKSQKYIPLVDVLLLHDYYEDGIFSDVRVVPDKKTQTFMWNSGLLLRLTDVGFSIFRADSFNAGYLEELTEFFKDHHLRFQLFGETGEFTNYTESPLGKLVVYHYSNRKMEDLGGNEVLSPKMEPRLFSNSPLANIDLYLDEFLATGEIQEKNYTIAYKARSTRWKYYLLNIQEPEAEQMVIVDDDGKEFKGPTQIKLPTGKPAFEFDSGEHLYPFSEQPRKYCSLKKKALSIAGESEEGDQEMLIEKLPVPAPRAITSIEENKDGDKQIACSSVYVYL